MADHKRSVIIKRLLKEKGWTASDLARVFTCTVYNEIINFMYDRLALHVHT